MSQKPSLIVISGPTGVGKTDVGIALAEPLGAEIVSADAMQVYRYMDIGTAKPTEQQQARVRHHLIDVVDPDEPFSAGRFKTMAEAVVGELDEKGRPVFVVGGTGLYIKALTRGIFSVPGEDRAIRDRLRAEAETLGPRVLHKRLVRVDPAAAARIHANDTYRIIRALEIFELTGKPLSEHQRAHGFSEDPYSIIRFGLFLDRKILYDRINARVDRMLASGLLDEVRGLRDQGYSSDLTSMRSIGYRHMTGYLEGAATWDETVRLFKRDTRRYAKRQLTWFGADPEIEWMQPADTDRMRRRIDSFLTREGIDT